MSKENLLKELKPYIISKYGKLYLNGEMRVEGLLLVINQAINQTREETIRDNNLVDLTGKNGDTIYHNDGLTGKRYTWKCINIEKLTN
jgi:hypothetical protein